MAAPAADGGAAANGQVAAPAAVAAAGAAHGNPNAAQEGAERAVKLFDINQPITIALAKAGQYPELEGMVPSDLMKPANPHELRSVTTWLKERGDICSWMFKETNMGNTTKRYRAAMGMNDTWPQTWTDHSMMGTNDMTVSLEQESPLYFPLRMWSQDPLKNYDEKKIRKLFLYSKRFKETTCLPSMYKVETRVFWKDRNLEAIDVRNTYKWPWSSDRLGPINAGGVTP